MNVVCYSEVRQNFKQVLDEVCSNHEPIVITRQRGEDVVMLSLADYNSLQETVYLLSSPKNAQRLMESAEQIKAAAAQIRSLIEIEPRR